MPSVEAGASALGGAITPKLTPAGAGLSPSANATHRETTDWSTQPDSGAYGTTRLSGACADIGAATGTAVVVHYKMRGLDVDCAPAVVYRVWVVTGSPDFTGAQYAGARCGVNPFSNIVVDDIW